MPGHQSVQVLSQFSSWPSEDHWKATKHVLHYLKGMQDFVIMYGGLCNSLNIKAFYFNFHLEGYSDVD